MQMAAVSVIITRNGQQQEPADREDTTEMAEAAADKRTGWKNEAGLCGVKRR